MVSASSLDPPESHVLRSCSYLHLLTACCGKCMQVHLIIRHKSPLTGDIEEKHLKFPPSVLTDSDTHVYTAILHTNNTCADAPPASASATTALSALSCIHRHGCIVWQASDEAKAMGLLEAEIVGQTGLWLCFASPG